MKKAIWCEEGNRGIQRSATHGRSSHYRRACNARHGCRCPASIEGFRRATLATSGALHVGADGHRARTAHRGLQPSPGLTWKEADVGKCRSDAKAPARHPRHVSDWRSLRPSSLLPATSHLDGGSSGPAQDPARRPTGDCRRIRPYGPGSDGEPRRRNEPGRLRNSSFTGRTMPIPPPSLG